MIYLLHILHFYFSPLALFFITTQKKNEGEFLFVLLLPSCMMGRKGKGEIERNDDIMKQNCV